MSKKEALEFLVHGEPGNWRGRQGILVAHPVPPSESRSWGEALPPLGKDRASPSAPLGPMEIILLSPTSKIPSFKTIPAR